MSKKIMGSSMRKKKHLKFMFNDWPEINCNS